MARRGHIGRRQGFQIDPSAFLQGGGEDNDVTKMAMALMGYGKGGPQDRAMEERKQQAEEMWRQGQLDISRLGETRQEKAAAAELARQEAERQQHVAERAEDTAYREKVFKAGEEEKGAERQRKGQEAQQGTFEKAMEKGLLTDPSGKFTTMGEEWLKDLDPQAAARLQKVAGLQAEKTYQEKLKSYKAMTPKKRAELDQPGSEAKIEELGGPEVYKRMVAEMQQQAQSKPNLTPTTGSAFGAAISKPWQEYQAPDLSELVGPKIPAPPPSGTEGIAPWLRPEAPSSGAMDWRYGGGGPSVDPGRYEKFPGSVEDLIAASGQQPPVSEPVPVSSAMPSMPILGGVPVPGGVSIIDEMLRKIRGRGDVGSSMPPVPPQGVFQPFPG